MILALNLSNGVLLYTPFTLPYLVDCLLLNGFALPLMLHPEHVRKHMMLEILFLYAFLDSLTNPLGERMTQP